MDEALEASVGQTATHQHVDQAVESTSRLNTTVSFCLLTRAAEGEVKVRAETQADDAHRFTPWHTPSED